MNIRVISCVIVAIVCTLLVARFETIPGAGPVQATEEEIIDAYDDAAIVTDTVNKKVYMRVVCVDGLWITLADTSGRHWQTSNSGPVNKEDLKPATIVEVELTTLDEMLVDIEILRIKP